MKELDITKNELTNLAFQIMSLCNISSGRLVIDINTARKSAKPYIEITKRQGSNTITTRIDI